MPRAQWSSIRGVAARGNVSGQQEIGRSHQEPDGFNRYLVLGSVCFPPTLSFLDGAYPRLAIACQAGGFFRPARCSFRDYCANIIFDPKTGQIVTIPVPTRPRPYSANRNAHGSRCALSISFTSSPKPSRYEC
jgi:hypothetical protein